MQFVAIPLLLFLTIGSEARRFYNSIWSTVVWIGIPLITLTIVALAQFRKNYRQNKLTYAKDYLSVMLTLPIFALIVDGLYLLVTK